MLILGMLGPAAAGGALADVRTTPAASLDRLAGVRGMELGAPAPAPVGFLRFCARRPDQCGLGATVAGPDLETRLIASYYWAVAFHSPTAVALEDAGTAAEARPLSLQDGLRTLKAINSSVNRSIRYESDIKQFGIEDYWTLPLASGGRGAGDCKDYVLEKRRALIDAGVPLSDLSIAIVRTQLGEDHAVLLVATDEGELVLDSRNSEVQPWTEVRYSWLERQAPGHQFAWVSL
jgi:predicted transglutaminase-like cysteine proteinase